MDNQSIRIGSRRRGPSNTTLSRAEPLFPSLLLSDSCVAIVSYTSYPRGLLFLQHSEHGRKAPMALCSMVQHTHEVTLDEATGLRQGLYRGAYTERQAVDSYLPSLTLKPLSLEA